MRRTYQEQLEESAIFHPVELGVIGIGHYVGVQISFLRVISDVMWKTFENGSVESFYLTILLRVVRCGEKVLGYQKAAYILK